MGLRARSALALSTAALGAVAIGVGTAALTSAEADASPAPAVTTGHVATAHAATTPAAAAHVTAAPRATASTLPAGTRTYVSPQYSWVTRVRAGEINSSELTSGSTLGGQEVTAHCTSGIRLNGPALNCPLTSDATGKRVGTLQVALRPSAYHKTSMVGRFVPGTSTPSTFTVPTTEVMSSFVDGRSAQKVTASAVRAAVAESALEAYSDEGEVTAPTPRTRCNVTESGRAFTCTVSGSKSHGADGTWTGRYQHSENGRSVYLVTKKA